MKKDKEPRYIAELWDIFVQFLKQMLVNKKNTTKEIGMLSLINRIKTEEGFSQKPYKCSEGVTTWGHGFTNITEEEADAVLRIRIKKELSWLNNKKNRLPFRYNKQPYNVREVLFDMTYQLGRTGLLQFKKMLQAIEDKDYKLASKELMDSKYAKQTPNRAKRNRDLLFYRR